MQGPIQIEPDQCRYDLQADLSEPEVGGISSRTPPQFESEEVAGPC